MKDAKLESEKAAAVEEEMDDGMQCNEHPHRSNPGGICALCLQEKLGNLVSSSFPLQLRCSSSSSTSPSFRSDSTNNGACLKPASLPHAAPNHSVRSGHYQEYYSRRVRIPFMLAKRGKKPTANDASDAVFKRSKSTSICSGGRRSSSQLNGYQDYTPRKKGFWSFLHLYPTKPRADKNPSFSNKESRPKEVSIASASRKVRDEEDTKLEDSTSMERKVSRSRSVGCGSRSFSGDFFERISTGFADCTLRRVESQREGKPKSFNSSGHMKERVRCGGILGGFIITSSSSSYWVSSSDGGLSNGRNRSWGWAFASPMRAFTRPATGRKDPKIAAPSITSIPSILSVRN